MQIAVLLVGWLLGAGVQLAVMLFVPLGDFSFSVSGGGGGELSSYHNTDAREGADVFCCRDLLLFQ